MTRGKLEPQDPIALKLTPPGQGSRHEDNVPSEFWFPLEFRFSTGFIQEQLFTSFCATIDAGVKPN